MKKFDSFRTRSFRAGGYSVAAVLIVLALLVSLNVIMEALPTSKTKLDATPTKIFTMSDQTKNVLKTLDKDLTFYWLCQESYEDPSLETLLNHYATASGHIKLERIDPDVNPGLTEQYTDEFYNNSVLIKCGDREKYVSYTDIYVMDAETYYSTGEELWNFEGEDALTRGIYYVVTDNLPKVYWINGHGELELDAVIEQSFVDENIDLAEMNLVTLAAIPEDADLLVCYLPTADVTDAEKKVLEDYMADGGRLLLVTSPLNDRLPRLESVLGAYGVTATDGIVIETGGNNYSQYPYALLPNLGSHDITAPVTKSGHYVLLPYSQGLKVTETGSTTLVVTELLTTTAGSYSKVNLQSSTTEKEAGDIDGPFSVGVAIEDAATGAQAVWYTSEYILKEYGGNTDLFYNAVNWMCDQQEMIAIRGKSVSTQYLNMNENSANTMTWIIVAIIPLGYLAIGINTYIRRKRR